MIEIITYLALFGIVVIIGQLFDRLVIPIALLLVFVGMLLSLIPNFSWVTLNPNLVLNIFLPLLIYQISAFASWQDFKKHIRPISLLSVGHVIFITILVALVLKKFIPELGWPLAFVIGAIVSPPDDVAILAIAEKIRMPGRVITILEGEGMLNDATALILFRFSLAAVTTHQFYLLHAASAFILVIVGETVYGLILGYILGELRLKITNPSLHVIASLLTPFLAYLPAEMLGGCGVIATVATGFVIGHIYGTRFAPEFRLVSRAMWPAISFALQSLLFLLVGLDMLTIMKRITVIPLQPLLLYIGLVLAVLIIGRFIYVYISAYTPRLLFSSIRKSEPKLLWQNVFIVSWAGMRGGISLAAALSVPFLPLLANGVNPRDLLLFLVYGVIVVTLLLQGLALPWLMKILNVEKFAKCEQYSEHIAELKARKKMIQAALRWLSEYKDQVKDNQKLLEEVKFCVQWYKILKLKLKTRITSHDLALPHDEKAEIDEETFLSLRLQLIEVEKTELLQLWRQEKINLTVRNKILDRLDHLAKNLAE
jgi:monovalent cation/hydrogen antiporter